MAQEINQNQDKTGLLWWGYKHISGTIHAKRYFDKRDIQEAYESPFCDIVVTEFLAKSTEEALAYIIDQTK